MDYEKWLGKNVEIVFLDHSQGTLGHPVCECVARGKLHAVFPDYLELACWEVFDDDDNLNSESFNILKSAIKRVYILGVTECYDQPGSPQ